MSNTAALAAKLFAPARVECLGANLAEFAPKQKALISRSSGWLENHCISSHQKEYWYKRYSWRDSDGKLRHKHVPRCKEKAIAALIKERLPIEEILRKLRG